MLLLINLRGNRSGILRPLSEQRGGKKKKLTGETASCILGLCEVQAVGIHYAINTIIISLFIETINPQDLICLYMCCTFFFS